MYQSSRPSEGKQVFSTSHIVCAMSLDILGHSCQPWGWWKPSPGPSSYPTTQGQPCQDVLISYNPSEDGVRPARHRDKGLFSQHHKSLYFIFTCLLPPEVPWVHVMLCTQRTLSIGNPNLPQQDLHKPGQAWPQRRRIIWGSKQTCPSAPEETWSVFQGSLLQIQTKCHQCLCSEDVQKLRRPWRTVPTGASSRVRKAIGRRGRCRSTRNGLLLWANDLFHIVISTAQM